MAKIKIASTDLIWIFREKMASFSECMPIVSIAIVPSSDGWIAVTSASVRSKYPMCAKRIKQVQNQLRKVYVLDID